MNSLTKTKRLQIAFLLGSLSLLGPFTIDTYLPAFPTIVEQFHTNASLVQVSLTTCLLGLAFGQLIIGPMSDVQGRRKPLLTFLGLYLLSSLICAIAPNIYMLIGARFIQGFAAAGGLVISRAVVRDLYSGRELTKFFATLMLIGNLGPIVAPIIGGAILSFASWKVVFLVLTCVGIILTLVVAFKLEETLPVEKRVPSNIKKVVSNFGSLLKDREFAGYAFTQGFTTAGIFAYVSGISFVYQNIYGVSPQVFSLLFGVNGVGLIIGTQIVGRLSRFSEKTFLKSGLALSMSASILLVIAILVHAPLVAVAIPIFLFVTSISIIGTSSFSLAMETKGHMAGSASALLGLLPFLLGSLTAPLVGIGGEHTAVPMGVIIFASSLLAFLSYYILVRKSAVKMNTPKHITHN
ncbi:MULTISPECIES: Bcr/CflA family multidrug efflux MFS transporter [Niallia]|uniref:Bcr/CflA family efflux transporter n=1 Tax=Niallia circulans TaxID=1397 RepID=A0A268F5W6_NIACI|nr:Bcr/CflA family multidrug efflux MFS transporter [Niallia circulans]AYV69592.1 Bcr/CflA family drug resistance efflux transporter [Niallia circulans]AYV72017.1 Bcr/CflA family drug resistance efflux transporter [Niallia circulans]NRG25873.1 Bcr/CflA family multidrug efflux MFS transporter [Niallia circulans]PAD80767.1 Bcr/CflA family drug resistance efflux transporter [Niallia circulans]QJX61082.1 Bcr/CflA family multidrug efflux MFS transporter [Niallia circulans]